MSATISDPGSSYLYGGVLYQTVAEREAPAKPPRASLATCLSQGLTTGAFMMFLLMIVIMLINSNNQNYYLVIRELPFLLVFGIVPGLIEGLVIWIFTRVAGHNLRWFMRLAVGASVFLLPVVILALMYTRKSSTVPITEYLIVLAIWGANGASYGVLTGSRFSPWRQLVRGDSSLPNGSWLATGFTGLVLRVAIVFFLMEAIVAFIAVVQSELWRQHFLWSLALLVHFVLAFSIVFTRFKFALLLPAALIINVPVALLLNYFLKEGPEEFAYLCIGYLVAWAVFLIARYTQTYKLVDFLKEEVNYYLLD